MRPDDDEVWGQWASAADRPDRSTGKRSDTPVTDYSNSPREATRVPLAHRIQLKFDRFSGFINEYVSNISPGGIFIRTDAPQSPGQLLDFEFRLGDGFELIRGRGEVVWARERSEGPERPPGMGVRFLELSPGSKDLIYKIVDDYVAHGGKPFDLTPPAPAAAGVEAPPAARPLGAKGSAPGAAPPAAATPLPWTLDIPAIQPLPGVPAITPRSPLESLGPLAPAVAGDPATPAMAAAAAPATPAGGQTGPAGTGVAPASEDGFQVHPDPWPAATEGADPLAQMAAALPPLDELAPDVPVLAGEDAGPQLVPAPPPVPASTAAAPGFAIPGTATAAPGPVVPGAASGVPGGGPAVPGAALVAPAVSGTASAVPGMAPAAPSGAAVGAAAPPTMFSSFDLRAPRRRSRLPMLAAAIAVVFLALVAWLLRDTAVAWMERREAATGGSAAGAPAARSAAPAPATPVPGSPGSPASAARQGVSTAARPAAAPAPGVPGAAPGSVASAAGSTGPGARSVTSAPAPGSTAAAAPGSTGAAVGSVTSGTSSSGAARRSMVSPPASTGAPSGPAAGSAARTAAAPAPGPATAAGVGGSAPRSAAASLLGAGASPAAGRATAVERISWQQAGDGLVVVLWGNGDFPSQSYTRVRVGGLPVREVIRISGIDRPFASPRLAVRSQELLQIRTGYHPPKDLHVVLDLGGSDVQVTDIEPGPRQLRIHLRR
jgi:molecular chaperone DnaK